MGITVWILHTISVKNNFLGIFFPPSPIPTRKKEWGLLKWGDFPEDHYLLILEQVVRGVTSHTEDPARNGPHFGSVSFVADILGESLYLLFSVCCGRPVWAVRGGWPGAFGPDGRCHRKMWPLPKKWPGGRIFLGKCNQGRGGRIFLRKSDRVGSASPRIIRPGGSDFPKGNPTRRVRFSSIL